MLLGLLMRYRRSYDQIAAALELSPQTVRRRAHRALRSLAPQEAQAVAPQRFAKLADLLIGQAGEEERLAAYSFLVADRRARAFVERAAAALEREDPELAGRWQRLLDLDGGEARPRGERRPLRGGPQVSRLQLPRLRLRPPRLPTGQLRRRLQGAAVLLLVGGAVAGLLVGLGVFSEPTGRPLSSAATQTAATVSSTTATASEAPRQLAAVKLEGSGGASGEAVVAAVGNRLTLALEARGLAPTPSGTYYIVWLYNSPTSFAPVGRAPSVGADGVLPASASELPGDAATYHELILTRERSPEPSSPGEIVLHGSLDLKGG